jgi:hypothetical protein
MFIRRSLLALSLSAAALSIGGCSSDPVGNWQSREKLPNGKRNRLRIEEDKTGALDVYVQINAQQGLVKLDYNLEDWFLEADGAYEMQFKCQSGCEAGVNVTLDFDMDCEYDDSVEHLDCKAGSPFTDYGFLEFELLVE